MNNGVSIWKVAGCISLGLIIGTIYSRTEPPPFIPTPQLQVDKVMGRNPDGTLIVRGSVGGVFGVFTANRELTYHIETLFDMEHSTATIGMGGYRKDVAGQEKWLRDQLTTGTKE